MIGENMGKKQLAINLIANIIAFATSLMISFILTPYLISNVGKEAYAFYPISANFVSYMAIVTIAFNSMTSRFITIEVVKKKLDKAQSYFSSAFFANIILIFILIIPMAMIVTYIDSFMNVPREIISDVRILFLLVFASMLINEISTVFGVATFVKNRMDLKAGNDIFQGILKAGLFILLFILFKPSIIFLGLVALILSITNFIIQFIYTKKLLPEFVISDKCFNFRIVKELLSSGVWNSINSLGVVLLMSISLLLSNMVINATASGDLAIVQTLPNLMTTIISAIYAVFLPRITHVYAKDDKNDIIKEVMFSQKILGLIATVPAVLIIIFGKEFFRLWLPNEDAAYLQILSIISIIPLIIHGNMWTIYGLIVTSNKLRTPSLVLIGVGIINITLSYLLLTYTDLGLPVIPLVNTAMNVLYYLLFIPIYISKQFKIKIFTFYPHIIKSMVFTVVFLLISFVFKRFINIHSWNDFFTWGSLFGILGLVINALFLLNNDDFKKIKKLLKRN